MTWTVSVLDMSCGHCLRPIPAGEPVALIGVPQRARCQACAAGHGFYPDLQELDLERVRLDLDAKRRDEARALAAATQRPLSRRVTLPRPPVPFSRLGEFIGAKFDPKAAAAGEDQQ
jgi:hypothetical protein